MSSAVWVKLSGNTVYWSLPVESYSLNCARISSWNPFEPKVRAARIVRSCFMDRQDISFIIKIIKTLAINDFQDVRGSA